MVIFYFLYEDQKNIPTNEIFQNNTEYITFPLRLYCCLCEPERKPGKIIQDMELDTWYDHNIL